MFLIVTLQLYLVKMFFHTGFALFVPNNFALFLAFTYMLNLDEFSVFRLSHLLLSPSS